jgi:hypothetical protein
MTRLFPFAARLRRLLTDIRGVGGFAAWHEGAAAQLDPGLRFAQPGRRGCFQSRFALLDIRVI